MKNFEKENYTKIETGVICNISKFNGRRWVMDIAPVYFESMPENTDVERYQFVHEASKEHPVFIISKVDYDFGNYKKVFFQEEDVMRLLAEYIEPAKEIDWQSVRNMAAMALGFSCYGEYLYKLDEDDSKTIDSFNQEVKKLTK